MPEPTGPNGPASRSEVDISNESHLTRAGSEVLGVLPLPLLAVRRDRSAELWCVVSTVDGSGRVGDRSAVRTLGWIPGQSIRIVAASGMVAVSADGEGTAAVTRQGRIRLHHTIRAVSGIRTTDRLLLAVFIEVGRLLILTMDFVYESLEALDIGAMLGRRHGRS